MMEETVEALMDGVATTVGAILEEETGEPVTKETAEDTRVLPTLVATEEGFVPAISIDDIKVGKRYRKELGDIPSLMESIARTGLLHPVVVVTTGSEHTLAAGRRRLEACRRLGWTYIPVRVLNLDDPLQAEHDENSCRLDLTPSEAVDIARALEERERERARENQAAGLKRGKVRKGKLPARQKGRVRDRVAKGTGYSGKTLKKAQVVVAAAETQPEKFGPLKEEMDSSGKVDGAYRKVIAEQQHPQQGQGPAARHRPLDSQVHELALAGKTLFDDLLQLIHQHILPTPPSPDWRGWKDWRALQRSVCYLEHQLTDTNIRVIHIMRPAHTPARLQTMLGIEKITKFAAPGAA